MNGVGSSTGDYGDHGLNQGAYTMMGYNYRGDTNGMDPGGTSGTGLYGFALTPMAFDIANLQARYGANMNYRTGNDVYNLVDANAVGTGFASIWDAGGIDAIQYDGARNATIDLRPATLQYEAGGGGYISHANGIFGGFTIANGAVVENAIGGSGHDILLGSAHNNVIAGRGADDQIDGGRGFDIAAFSSTFSAYNFARSGIATFVAGPDGTDTLYNSELLSFSNVTVRSTPTSDFTGELGGDLVLRSQSQGVVTMWKLSNGQFESSSLLGGVGSNIQVVGEGDFNKDGTSDLLLRDTTTGGVSTWTILNGQYQGTATLGGIGSNISVAGTGDFDGDGVSDVLLRDRTTGEVVLWKVNQDNSFGGAYGLGGIGSNIEIAAVGDMTYDGHSDILLRDYSTGALILWQIANNVLGNSSLLGGIGSNVEVVDIHDFTGNGNEDLLLRDRSTGDISYWNINTDGSFGGSQQIGGVPSWYEMVGARDIDHNGYADVLVRDTNTGAIGAFATYEGIYANNFYNLGGAGSDWLLS